MYPIVLLKLSSHSEIKLASGIGPYNNDNMMMMITILLSEPASGFQIAFNMFDTDGNQRVDKNEFLVVSMI